MVFKPLAHLANPKPRKLCRANHFDVLISDLLLFDGHGLELLDEILKIYPIRAIACSGLGNEERENCLAGGFDAYFSKPIQIEDLLKSLAEADHPPLFLVPSKEYGKDTPKR